MNNNGASNIVLVLFRWTYLGIALAMLIACQQQAPHSTERVRAIKTITVSERASGKLRKFPGVIEAVDKSGLSFEVSGNVQTVLVNVGDRINAGQVLAVLDSRTFELDVEAAQAELARARAQRLEKQREFQRQQNIIKEDPGATTEQALDAARAAYKTARSNLRVGQSKLNLAQRDLEKTRLVAPFNGVIGERYIEPFEEVARGKPVFDFFAEGGMEVLLSIPETLIQYLRLGQPAEIRFPKEPDQIYRGAISEISSLAGAANAFPVKVSVHGDNKNILPGMTAEVSVKLSGDEETNAYLIPIQALLAGDDATHAYVFKFDPQTSTVQKTRVEGGGVRGSHAVVSSGVKPGDIIVVAGVSFLEDGQNVKLLQQKDSAQRDLNLER